MDSQANSLINPDARNAVAGTPPNAAMAAGALPGAGAGAAGADFGLGGFAERLSGFPNLSRMRTNPKLPFVIVTALAIAAIVALVLWSRAPDYKVLYSNLSDRDGGAIIAALQQANIPYKFTDAGGAILVPPSLVHETRLKLAAMGLPKGGSVGFELMDNQKFGISQFAEQVNYQRALEGELERTIESINAVRGARVHLAIPKPSVFVREREAPSASVFVDLYPGRVLDDGQVLAITRMVASGVPDMPAKNVTIVDQDGNLLSQQQSAAGLDASQLKYVQQVERNTQKRIDAILAPMFGAGNARSQVSADVDFSKVEQTSESYGPNGTPQQAAIRSQQTSSSTEMSQSGAGGRARRAVEHAAAAGLGADHRRQRRGRHAAHADQRPQGFDHQLRARQDGPPRRAGHRRHQAPVGGGGRQLPAGGRRQGPRDDAAAQRRQARAGRAAREGRDGLRRQARRLGERGQQPRSRPSWPIRRPTCPGGARRT